MAKTPDDDLIREEEAAAASDAGRIGGRAGDEEDWSPEMRPVYEGGGGEAEGFETAESDLVENASHGDGHGEPLSDAYPGEVESDRSGAVYGDADGVETTEVVRDRDEPRDDPGRGPQIDTER
jgi:hypothetical protein